MIYVIIGISLIFGSLTFNLTKVNAQHYLAGNNTMPKEQREQIDIEVYLKMFKKTHIILGLSTLILGIATLLWFGDRIVALFISVYPLLFYGYFHFKTIHYLSKKSKNKLSTYFFLRTLDEKLHI